MGTREKTIEARIDGKGIRLDVYVEEKDTNRSFDVEIQISNSDNLAKRTRYYQSLIDTDKLKRGQHYSCLGESFIIFICPFDIFKQCPPLVHLSQTLRPRYFACSERRDYQNFSQHKGDSW
ncbi:MAG: Rpn family recombination-promoting nuclease/putative transposase [Selenomonadaceae bacterium]|nr:Rpn family recombination-promoting nuclease/putative transposase [Selenomonadaceae bacterium]